MRRILDSHFHRQVALGDRWDDERETTRVGSGKAPEKEKISRRSTAAARCSDGDRAAPNQLPGGRPAADQEVSLSWACTVPKEPQPFLEDVVRHGGTNAAEDEHGCHVFVGISRLLEEQVPSRYQQPRDVKENGYDGKRPNSIELRAQLKTLQVCLPDLRVAAAGNPRDKHEDCCWSGA